MNCPKCDSPDIRKFSVIYESGTTVGDFSGGAVGVSRDGGLAGGVLTGSSGSQTLLAKRVTPPKANGAVTTFFQSVAVIVIAIAFDKWEYGSLGGLGLGFGAFTLFMVFFAALLTWDHKNLVRSLPARRKRWENSWLCMKCGYEFVEKPGSSQALSHQPSILSDSKLRYYYVTYGEQQGPVEANDLRLMRKDGLIADDTPVIREGESDWRQFRDYLALTR